MVLPELLLASSSPKRKEILNSLNLSFKTRSPKVEELTMATSPSALVKANALLKVQAVVRSHPHCLVLGADTIVTSGKKIFLKPRNWKDGLRMFRSYRKNINYVYTALTIYEPAQQRHLSQFQKSRFRLADMPIKRQEEIFQRIFSTQQSGGFSIEGLGSIVLDEISGSYYNILGLPVYLLDRMLQELGYDLLQFQKNKPLPNKPLPIKD